jgi:hypothetical protein
MVQRISPNPLLLLPPKTVETESKNTSLVRTVSIERFGVEK